MKATLAERLGSTPHLSPLLRKMRRLGFGDPDALLRLAVRRGCAHYAPPDYHPAQVRDPGTDRLSNLDLAVALCSAAQEYDPRLVRCAAQLLSSGEIDAAALVRAAQMERCEPVIAHIAQAAVEFDSGHAAHWRTVLARLRVRRPPPAGTLPHRSRFMLEVGLTDPRAPKPRAVWLRPKADA